MKALNFQEMRGILAGANLHPIDLERDIHFIHDIVGDGKDIKIHRFGRFFSATLDGVQVLRVYFPIEGPAIVIAS